MRTQSEKCHVNPNLVQFTMIQKFNDLRRKEGGRGGKEFISSQSTIDSEGFKGGTRGAPIMSRDAVSRTANVGT